MRQKQDFSSLRDFSRRKRMVCLYMCLPRTRHVLQRPVSPRHHQIPLISLAAVEFNARLSLSLLHRLTRGLRSIDSPSPMVYIYNFFNNIILIVNRKNKWQFEKITKIGACRPLESRQEGNRLSEGRQPTWHVMWRTRTTRTRPVGTKRTCRPLDGR